MIQALLTRDRRLSRGNPDPSALGEDFGRFGLRWWPALASADSRTSIRQEQLRRLVTARNGIAHADDSKLDALRQDGYPITLRTVSSWHRAINGLATTMDVTLGRHLQEMSGGEAPW